MTKMSYFEQLKHPNWQRCRLRRLDAAGWECSNCCSTEATLHVHHRRYIKGRMAWEYDDAELVVLCEKCHASDHQARDVFDEILATTDMGIPVHMAAALLGGYLYAQYALKDDVAGRARALCPRSFNAGLFAEFVGIAPRRQHADFVRRVYSEFEDDGRISSVPLGPIAEHVLSRWDAEESA